VEVIGDRAREVDARWLECLAGLELRLDFLALRTVVDRLVLVLARDRASCVQQAQNNDQREAHPPLLPKRKKRPRKQAAQSSNRSEKRASVGLKRRARCDVAHTGPVENEKRLSLHRLEELAVGLGVLHLVQQEFDRRQLVHRMQQLAQDPHLRQLTLVGDELFLARTRTIDVERREHALLGDAPVEMYLAVARALELLVDHVVHLGPRVDESRGQDREAAAFLDVARGAEEALRALQG